MSVVSPAPNCAPVTPPRAKSKMPRPSRKKSRFSGKEQAEAREVHLLLVDLDLREVGVDGEVGGEVRR